MIHGGSFCTIRNCGACRMLREQRREPTSAFRLAAPLAIGPVIAALAVLGLCMFGGCATVKSDAKAIAEVCRPELAPDVATALPYVAALAVCEVQHNDCSSILTTLKDLGKADAQACATAQIHQEIVNLSGKDAVKLPVDGGAP